MSEKDKKPLMPKLRFPEFRESGEWLVTKFADIAEFYKGKGISKADIEPDGKTPCIRYGELYTHYNEIIKDVYSRTNIPISELFLSKRNDVIIPSSGETKEDIATAACVMLDGVALGGDINIIRCTENGIFLSYYLNGSKNKEIAKIAQGDSIVHLYLKQLIGLDLLLPKEKKEQRKIADCLSSLDELITAENKKLEAYKVYKKGLMQKLFPTEGETVPKWRFPEFRGEWEKAELGALFENRQETGFFSLPLMSLTEQDGIIPQEETNRKNNSNSDKSNYLRICPGDVVYNTMRMWQGRCAYVDVEGIVSPAYTVCKPIKKNNGLFFYYLFKTFHMISEFHANSQGLVNDTLSLKYDSFSKISIFYPSILEQQKIADCLSSLDEVITAQSQKIEALKAHKKGLMQGLFPSAEEVNV